MQIIEDLFYALISIIEKSVQGFIALVKWAVGAKQQAMYTAEFISPSKILKRIHVGYCLTGTLRLPLEQSFRNVLIIGGTGTGKSSVVLLPSLYTMMGSFVVHDPSGELYQKSAGYLKQRGYMLHTLNFSDVSSDGFNPITRAVTSADINKVASLLIRTALEGNTDPFWNQQAITLLAIIIHLVKTQEKLYQNLAGVRSFLTVLRVNPQELATYLKRIPHHEIYLEYQAFVRLDEKVKAGVIATVLAALQILTDSTVARVTAHDSIDLKQLRRKPTAIFIQNPVAQQQYYTSITSIFIEQLLAHQLNRLPLPTDLPVHLLIDEASSLYLPSLSIAIANVRKYRTSILLSLQDFNQLIHTYGIAQAQTIKANCFAKLYFTGQSLPTAIELEQSLGLSPRVDSEGNVAIRPLITKEELRTLPTNRGLLICGNYQPMIVKLKPYYRSRKFARYSLYPPPPKRPLAPIIQLPNSNLFTHHDQVKPPSNLPILPKQGSQTTGVSTSISTTKTEEI